MTDIIVTLIIGIIVIVMGISHTKGNISLLHSYHRKRVSEADRLPFGKKVGLGTIICGSALSVFGILQGVVYFSGEKVLSIIGAAILIAGLITGIIIIFSAMIKYNKGIF